MEVLPLSPLLQHRLYRHKDLAEVQEFQLVMLLKM